MTELIQEVSLNNALNCGVYQLRGSLAELLVVCQEKDRPQIQSIQTQLLEIYQGGCIQRSELENLESMQKQLISIMQGDPRLRELFKVSNEDYLDRKRTLPSPSQRSDRPHQKTARRYSPRLLLVYSRDQYGIPR